MVSPKRTERRAIEGKDDSSSPPLTTEGKISPTTPTPNMKEQVLSGKTHLIFSPGKEGRTIEGKDSSSSTPLTTEGKVTPTPGPKIHDQVVTTAKTNLIGMFSKALAMPLLPVSSNVSDKTSTTKHVMKSSTVVHTTLENLITNLINPEHAIRTIGFEKIKSINMRSGIPAPRIIYGNLKNENNYSSTIKRIVVASYKVSSSADGVFSLLLYIEGK